MKKGSKQANIKPLRLLLLKDYILNNADEKHGVKINDMINYFIDKYGVEFNIRTFYRDIDTLNEFEKKKKSGIEIKYDGRDRDYKISKPNFKAFELQLLIDSIQSSKFITERRAAMLTNKLKKLTSKHGQKSLDRRVYVPERVRNADENAQLFKDIETIHRCIETGKQISFKRWEYNSKKEKAYIEYTYFNKEKENNINTTGRAYANPLALVWKDNQYYLITGGIGSDEKLMTVNFRVDRIEDVQETEFDVRGRAEFDKQNKAALKDAISNVSMIGGKLPQKVTLRFRHSDVDIPINRFGIDIPIIQVDQRYIHVIVDVVVGAEFFGWLFSIDIFAKIVSPAEVVEEYQKHLQRGLDLYEYDHTDPQMYF